MSNHLEILRQNGKSFYWAGKLLPKKYFVRCAELYSFCRLLDDIADTNTKDENFIKLNFILDLIEKNDYQKLEENNIYVPSYLKNCELAKSKIIDLIHGLIFDQKLVRIKTEEQLQFEGDFKVCMSWGNVSGPDSGGCHQAHRHPFSYLSGIYYLTEGSPTVFQDPLTPRTMNQLEIISGTYENAVAIEPTVGQLLIWPSWMIHWSVPHHGPEPRAVIAWNALPDGGINFGPYGQNMVNLKVN